MLHGFGVQARRSEEYVVTAPRTVGMSPRSFDWGTLSLGPWPSGPPCPNSHSSAGAMDRANLAAPGASDSWRHSRPGSQQEPFLLRLSRGRPIRTGRDEICGKTQTCPSSAKMWRRASLKLPTRACPGSSWALLENRFAWTPRKTGEIRNAIGAHKVESSTVPQARNGPNRAAQGAWARGLSFCSPTE